MHVVMSSSLKIFHFPNLLPSSLLPFPSSHAFYSISDFLIRLWGLGHPGLGHGVGCQLCWHFSKNMHFLAHHVKVSFLGWFPNPAQPHIPSHPSQLLPGLVAQSVEQCRPYACGHGFKPQDFFTFPIFFLPLSCPTLLSSHAFYSISDFIIRLWGL